VPILNRYLSGFFSEDYTTIEATQKNIASTGFIGDFITGTQTIFPLVGPNPYNNITGVYTVPETGFYLCTFSMTLSNITTVAGLQFGFSINGSTVGPPNPHWGEFAPVYTADVTIRGEALFQFIAGDIIVPAGAAFVNGGGTMDISAILNIYGEAEILDGFNLDLRYVIDPSLKVIDMIRGLSHAFNLVFETNEGSRQVRIEPADDYILDSRLATTDLEDGFYTAQKAIDYTPFVDLSKGGELVSDTKQLSQLRLKWKDDSNDPTVEALNLNQNLGILEARYNFPSNRFKVGENVVENPFFAPTLVIADNEVQGANSLKTPMIPIIWSTNYLETSTSTETVTQILPRLLVSDPTLSFADYPNGTINVFDGVGTTLYANPLNYMIDYNDTTGFQTSLSFGDVTVNGFAVAGLMKRLYLSEMVRRSGGKYLELFILWDVLMMQNLTFRHKFLINNNTYILQEINTFDVAKNQSTKTYFVLDNKEVGADANIQSTILTAKINTV